MPGTHFVQQALRMGDKCSLHSRNFHVQSNNTDASACKAPGSNGTVPAPLAPPLTVQPTRMQRENFLKSLLNSEKPAPYLAQMHATREDTEAVLARGHLLIEDLPGVGKTTLAHALARSLGLSFARIQFTSDLLPADILGASIFDRETSNFRFHAGPIFAHLVLADEVNRATPKAQSALLEAMEERQVTLDGNTRSLPDPFFVIATQNPSSQVGTFALPESQLDRFLMRIRLGFPDALAERALLAGDDRREMLKALTPRITFEQIRRLQACVRGIHVADP